MTATITTAAPEREPASSAAGEAVDANAQTLRAARAAYFAASGFDERTYTSDWVELEFGPLPFRFPNTEGRKRIVPLHDLHHALTGYSAKLSGETEIAAFEVGGGMRDAWIGWFLNLLTFSWGAVWRPRAILRAFLRGRRSVNLYQEAPEPGLLDQPVAEVRAARGIAEADESLSASAGDIAVFLGWWLAAIPVAIVGFSLVPLVFVLGLWGAVQRRSDG